jgi:hypothetical protein
MNTRIDLQSRNGRIDGLSGPAVIPPVIPAVISGGMSEPLGGYGNANGGPCLELLNITKPREVRAAHDRYLAAGATVLRTNTANASPERLDRYRMHDEAFIVSYMAAEHARDAVKRAREADGIARTVLGVARVETRSPHQGFLPLDRVEAAARTMGSGLAGGGADIILLEIGQDPARLLAAVSGLRHGMADAGRVLPIHLKLRYDPLFGVPARHRVTEDLVRAAALAAGLNLAALSVAPLNLADTWLETLRAMGRAYQGALFAESTRGVDEIGPLLVDAEVGPRLKHIGGGLTPRDTELLLQRAESVGFDRAPAASDMAANDAGGHSEHRRGDRAG